MTHDLHPRTRYVIISFTHMLTQRPAPTTITLERAPELSMIQEVEPPQSQSPENATSCSRRGWWKPLKKVRSRNMVNSLARQYTSNCTRMLRDLLQ